MADSEGRGLFFFGQTWVEGGEGGCVRAGVVCVLNMFLTMRIVCNFMIATVVA